MLARGVLEMWLLCLDLLARGVLEMWRLCLDVVAIGIVEMWRLCSDVVAKGVLEIWLLCLDDVMATCFRGVCWKSELAKWWLCDSHTIILKQKLPSSFQE